MRNTTQSQSYNSFKVFSLILLSSLLFSCTPNTKKTNKPLLINGAGASFPYILYSKWLTEYHKLKPSVQINYQSIGSSGGIRQFLNGTLDFGASDVYTHKQDLQKTNKKILHIPSALGAVAVTYRLKLSSPEPLLFDRKVLSKIFTGEIKKWNHPEIQALNPKQSLPDIPIVIAYRADGSGTTAFFTEFLAKDSLFLKKIGKGKSVHWPVGVGGKGNEGVMGLIHKIEGSISYISLSYALSQKISIAKIKNKNGHFILPSSASIKSAADHTLKIKKDFSASLIDAGGASSYPLSGFTYIIISETMPTKKGKEITEFLKWVLSSGQQFSEELYFIPLPKSVVNSSLKKLSEVRYQ